MSAYNPAQISEISHQFQIYGDLQHVAPCKIGHINETYFATYEQGGTTVRYVHQKLNTEVFKDPDAVMNNIDRATRHQRRQLEAKGIKDVSRRVLTVIPTRNGKLFHRSPDGTCWRTFVLVERVKSYESVTSLEHAYEAGKAFGAFQLSLADIGGTRFADTIPYFHNTRRRYDALLAAIKADPCKRVSQAEPEIRFALEHEKIVDVILKEMAKGRIPERVTHNDTKFNNVMLDETTQKAMCVVDLDTVMPGCSLYDFGDMVRTTTSPTLEDERDLSKVEMQMPLFKKLCRGYLEAAGPMLNRHERALVAFSGKLMTFTIGLRFLTDFINGDVYFRVHRPGHNLDRARTQLRLVQSIERHEPAMQKYADSI